MPSGNPTDAFKTHSNYIKAFARLVAPRVPMPSPALRSVAAAVKALPAGKTTAPNATGALNSLSIAWRTELLLDLTATALADDDDFAKLANTWAVIQVYYVFYHCTQALAQAKGADRPPSHPKTQKMFYDYWAQRPINLPPWTLAFGRGGPENGPRGVEIDDRLHAWSACTADTCWSLAAKALRTTREDAIEDAITEKRDQAKRERKRKWETEEATRLEGGRRPRAKPRFAKPNLSAEEKAAVRQHVRPHTVMDYLYRLRIKTNYEDSAMFTDGPDVAGESQAVLTNLRRLCSATLLIHELSLAGLLGSDVLRNHASAFLTTTAPSGIPVSLRDRTGFLQEIP